MENENQASFDAVTQYINELSGTDVKESENHQPEETKKEEVKEVAKEASKEEKPENYDIRIKKALEQRDEARKKAEELESKMAHIQGQIDAMVKMNTTPEQDPTEVMTDTEKALYLELQKTKQEMQSMADMVNQVEQKSKQNEYQTREENFWKSNPQYDTEEKKQEIREAMTEYAKSNQEIAKLLLQGQITLNEVHTLALIKAGKFPTTQSKPEDSTKVFGNGKTEPSPVNVAATGSNDVEKAIKILRNKESTNKGEATDVIVKTFANDIMAGMGLK